MRFSDLNIGELFVTGTKIGVYQKISANEYQVVKYGNSFFTLGRRGEWIWDYLTVEKYQPIIVEAETKEFSFSNNTVVTIHKNGTVTNSKENTGRKNSLWVNTFTPEAIKAYGKWTKYTRMSKGVELPYSVGVTSGILAIGCLEFDIEEFREFIKTYENFVDKS